MPEHVIVTRGLAKLYPRGVGLRPLDLTVERGEIFGFLGPNGAGKTTTIRTLLGFLRPTAGEGEVLGVDVRTRARDLRARVGYLPGELHLDPDRTGAELSDLVGRLRGHLDRAYAHELAARLGLDLTRRVGTLSKGNKQKVGLLLALQGRPDLLILDEPTDGLDPLVQEEVLTILREARAEGRTVFLSSHVLAEVDRIADRVGIIRAGELVTVSGVAEVKARLPHRVEVRFAQPVPEAAFARLSGVRDVRVRGDTLSCVLDGGADALVKALAAHTVLDLRGSEPDLEQAFLSYYQEDHHVA
ncbi:ABC transporter ATP-binding protein [Deinococcus pimensis]|uniref:ABC transporter ATP-binding protein n=1 Tax=Deinococcus pimensis TaxID=309888 RepID=UPI00047F79EE|nr:ABC transporter ATP-binding protein [Deinococcus pimensis]